MKFTLVCLFFILSTTAFSYDKEFVITDILTDDIIKVQRLDSNIPVAEGDLLLIYSQTSRSILGYARAEVLDLDNNFFTASIKTHAKSGIVRPENFLKKVDLTKSKNEEMPASFELLYKENSKAAAKYYNKYAVHHPDVSYYILPSPSGANAGKSFAQKLEEWTILRSFTK